ncbi:MAG: hypothetical protein K0S44_353 [Bacteroidetes bacterium]|nr:hypothetical protein [Bacteroidota bacterium]
MRYIFICLIFISFKTFSQGKFKLFTTIETEADFFTTDNQSNVYVVKKDELIKYNKSGKLLYKFSNKNFGDISYVDASNMLRLLVYYKDFSQAVFLDNTLSLNGEPISFDKIGFQQVGLVCTSFNNGMWIFNQQNFSLTQLNTSYEVSHQTDNLHNLLNIELQPTIIMEKDNRVYINNPATGILIFDIYGTYYKTIPVKNTKEFQVIGDWVYYRIENNIKAYNIKTTEESEFNVPTSDFSGFRLEVEFLFLHTPKGISVYAAES